MNIRSLSLPAGLTRTALAVTFAVAFSPLALVAQPLTKAPANFDELVKAAKAEGELTVIACPHDWVNYGEIFEKFSAKYGIKLNELNPDGSSGEEIEAVKANKNNKGRQAPDVLDVGLSFGPQMKADGLVAPYKVKDWATIPDGVKDKDGYWYGDYYGALAFEVNTDIIKNPPQDWKDLLKPEYKGKFALAGDPRTSNQAFLTVAAVATSTSGSLTNIKPGLEFFKKLNEAGNFVPIIAVPGTVASGETPITVRWDYNALANRDKSAGNPNIGVIIPKSGVLAGVYIQAISAYAPHPAAARLYMEYLYSDEGQLLWLKGYGHPVRFGDLAKRKVIPADLAAKLPPAAAYAKAMFPTIEQQEAIKKSSSEDWDKIVNVAVSKK